jgi:hypothetical protein
VERTQKRTSINEGDHHPTLVLLKKHSVTDAGEVLYELKAPVGKKQNSKSRVIIDPLKPS